MNTKTNFTLKYPQIIFNLCLFLISIFVLILFITSSPNIAEYVCISIFIFIPSAFTALWAKMFRIKVNDEQIKVRKCLGLINYCFCTDDIVRVEWKTTKTKFGDNELITIFFKNNKKVKIATLVTNFEEMKLFIENKVSINKIHRI